MGGAQSLGAGGVGPRAPANGSRTPSRAPAAAAAASTPRAA